MKKFSRIVSLILAFCMMVIVPVSASNHPDITSENMISVLRVLDALEIWEYEGEDVNFRPDDFLTRGEAVKYINNLLNLEENLYFSDKAFFKDVSSEHEYYTDIQMSAMAGLIAGNDGINFYPNDNITTIQMLKIIICGLEYGSLAEYMGGYPQGYLLAAGRLGLLNGIKIQSDVEITRRDAALLLYNALDVPVVDWYVFSKGAYVTQSDDETVLTEKLDCVRGKGIVTANEYTAIGTFKNASKEQVRIGDMVFNIGETDASSLIGHYVEFYAKETESDYYEIKGIWADEERYTEVDARDIIANKTSTTVLNAYLNNSDRILSYDIEIGADLIYNGMLRVFDDKNLITPRFGKVCLIDSDKNGKYDVIKVTSYQLFIVDRVSVGDEELFFKENPYSVNYIDLQERVEAYKIFKNGKLSNISQVAEWNVAQIALPDGVGFGQAIIHITDKKVSGKIEQLKGDYVVINGKTYEKAMPESTIYLKNIKLGDFVQGFLDMNGYLVDVEKMSGSEESGFLYNIGIKRDAFDTVVRMTIYTKSGEWIEVDVAKKVKLNGVMKTAEDLYALLQRKVDAKGIYVDKDGYRVNLIGEYVSLSGSGANQEIVTVTERVAGELPFKDDTARQIILFTTNAKNEIISVRTAVEANAGTGADDEFIISGDYSSTKIQYREGLGFRGFFILSDSVLKTYFSSFFVDENTYMFEIPLNNLNDKISYRVRKGSELGQTDWDIKAVTYGFRDTKKTESVPYLLVNSNSSTIYSTAVLVKEVEEVMNEDGDVVKILTGYDSSNSGKEVAYNVPKAEAIQKDGGILETGDLVRLILNPDGSVKDVQELDGDIAYNVSKTFDEQKGAVYDTGSSSPYRAVMWIVGKVTEINTQKQRIALEDNLSTPNGAQTIPALLGFRTRALKTNVYIVHRDRKIIEAGKTIADIKLDDQVAAYMQDTNVHTVVVYR